MKQLSKKELEAAYYDYLESGKHTPSPKVRKISDRLESTINELNCEIGKHIFVAGFQLGYEAGCEKAKKGGAV